MKADRQLRVLLVLITFALFVNALNPWFQSTPTVSAQTPPADLPMMEVHLRNLESRMEGVERDIGRIVELIEGSTTQRAECSWTMISDGGTPRIGRNGEIDLSPDWERVSNAGWTLKAVHNDEFIFERCR